MTSHNRCVVTVCRDCCCGSRTKHPEVDHLAQVRRLRTALGRVGAVRVSECLDVCEQSNVVVVNPSPAGRRQGGRPTWLGLLLSDDALEDVISWVDAGGPGIAPLPPALDLHVTRAPGAR